MRNTLKNVVTLSAIPAFLFLPYQVFSFHAEPGSIAARLIESSVINQESKQEATRIWEQAIAAKGGRERLYSISNMVISEASEYITHKGRKNQVRRKELYVFPNKYWFLEDYGSDVFGTQMHMYNYDSNTQYIGSPDSPETILEPATDKSKVPWIDNAPLLILLETKWLKPVAVKAAVERVGGKTVDVIETRVNGRQVDFAFDQESHLPIRLTFHNKLNNHTWLHSVRLKDYVKVDGILVPETIILEGAEEGGGKQSVRFNVDYDEKIFVKPPRKTSGGIPRGRNHFINAGGTP